MDREQQWMRSAYGLAVVAADAARAPSLLRELSRDCAELLQLSAAAVLPAGADPAGRTLTGEQAADCLRDDRALPNIDVREQAPRRTGPAGHAPDGGRTLVTLLPLHDSAGRPRAVLQLVSGDRELSVTETEAAQQLGDLAMVLREQSDELHGLRETAGQLSRALDSRVVIEQAKGMLAEQLRTGTGEAFDVLRGHARSHRLKVAEVARAVVDRELRLGGTPPDRSDNG
ncbi:ANTAR domain-containing protein [Streptomyces sp. SID10853]|uniref:ANTAR domain-containing protein n=1 Tax=Streptomyces sp. SID10853 TaxID=2706028 RepID=UPI0013C0295E|nr:ANTAR domain-containing protein [Streptomyces sp. SID10853]NDZ77554.1 ANTAR domain-containing protein [Streptomyces sp. SID10853]